MSTKTYTKRIVCLANSRKLTGRCLAGKAYDGKSFGEWIRPVSQRDGGELSEEERRYKDGSDPKVLDIIQIPLSSAKPHEYQAENHVIDDGYYWAKEGALSVKDIRKALDVVKGPLWDNSSSTRNGLLDQVPEETAAKLTTSLKLIEVPNLKIDVAVEGAGYPNAKRKVRGRFSLNGFNYKLAITDPVIERRYLQKGDGTYSIGKALLCISLGEPYRGFAYKLIAAVFTE